MPGYNRFVELARRALPTMLVFLTTQTGECTGIGVVDATTLRVCHNRRMHSHRVFKGTAQRGKSSMGWFYGFKLHAVFNHLGELVNFFLSPGNMDDRKGLKQMAGKLFGTLIGDRGCIGKELVQWLKEEYGIKLRPLQNPGQRISRNIFYDVSADF